MLSIYGGGEESNLSRYMAAPANSESYVNFGAGTLRSGIEKVIKEGNFKGKLSLQVIQENIRGYLISHAHLDHASGLILNSPDDTKKSIYALPSVVFKKIPHRIFWSIQFQTSHREICNYIFFHLLGCEKITEQTN